MTEEEGECAQLWEESFPHSSNFDEKPIVSGPCLVCYQIYDYNSKIEGNANQCNQYTQHEMFSAFCKVLGTTEKDKPTSFWSFNKEQGEQTVLPFCKMCRELLTSLADVYSKLEELELVIRKKMMESVEKGKNGNLDKRYLEFRKEALKGLPKERNIRPSTSQEMKARSKSAPCSSQPDSLTPNESPPNPVYHLRKRQRTEDFSKSAVINSTDEREDSDYDVHDNDDYESSSVSSDVSQTSSDSDSDFGASPKAKRRKPKYSGGTQSKLMKQSPSPPAKKNNSSEHRKTSCSSSSSTSTTVKASSSLVFIPEQKITVKIVPTTSQTVANSARTPRLQPEKKKTSSSSSTSSQPPATSSLTVSSNNPGQTSVPPTWSCKLCRNEPSFTSTNIITEHWTTIHKISSQTEYDKLLKLRKLKSKPDGRSRFHTPAGWVVECGKCKELFSNCFSREWNDHQRSHELEKMWGVEAKANCCQLCRDKPEFSSEELMDSHLATVHLIQNRRKYSDMMMLMIDRCKDGRKRYHTANGWITECDICGKPFTSNRSMEWKNHKWSHLSDAEKEEFILMNKGVKNQTDILIPTEEQLANGFVTICPKCGKAIRGGRKRFRVHMSRHHRPDEEEKLKYICSFCGKTYSDKNCFEKHTAKEHRDEKITPSYKCQFPSCEQRFDEENSLRQHVSSEHGDCAGLGKKRVCDLCGKLMFDSSNIKKHKNSVHFNQKLFECHICSKRLSSSGSLKDHLGSVHKQGELHGKFECDKPDCGRVFPLKSYLLDHLRKHRRDSVKISGKSNPVNITAPR